MRLLTFPYYYIGDPELIREALIDQSETFVIQGGASAGLARLIGHGILTNRGEDWRASRKGLQPLFQKVDSYTGVIRERVTETLERWKGLKEFPLNRELLALSFRIKASALFGSLPSFEEALEFADAIWVLQSDGMERYLRGLDYLPWLPLPLNGRVIRAKRSLYRLSRKIHEAGSGQPLDEILSIFFAGAESPANTLAWALLLLHRHPEILSGVRGGDDVLLEQALSETLRLYPAGWAFERSAPRGGTLGGNPIAKGGRMLFSPFVLHRSARYWKDPERFDPSRFRSGLTAPEGQPKYSYIPFGAGPRSCIGSRLAWLEMKTTLAMLVPRVEFSFAEPEPRPRGSFKIRLSLPLLVRARVA